MLLARRTAHHAHTQNFLQISQESLDHSAMSCSNLIPSRSVFFFVLLIVTAAHATRLTIPFSEKRTKVFRSNRRTFGKSCLADLSTRCKICLQPSFRSSCNNILENGLLNARSTPGYQFPRAPRNLLGLFASVGISEGPRLSCLGFVSLLFYRRACTFNRSWRAHRAKGLLQAAIDTFQLRPGVFLSKLGNGRRYEIRWRPTSPMGRIAPSSRLPTETTLEGINNGWLDIIQSFPNCDRGSVSTTADGNGWMTTLNC